VELKPTETTYWFAHFASLGVVHMGVTEPGQVTTTNPDEFKQGKENDDLLPDIDKHKDLLPRADLQPAEQPARVGFFVLDGKIAHLKKADRGKKLLTAVQEKVNP
jgi:hypothetical protein